MIAIPDFSSGAMENWGLITYRETALLFNEGVSSESNKKRVATVVSHELAHQVWNKNTLYSKKLSDLIIFQSKQKLTSLESFFTFKHEKKRTHSRATVPPILLRGDIVLTFPAKIRLPIASKIGELCYSYNHGKNVQQE